MVDHLGFATAKLIDLAPTLVTAVDHLRADTRMWGKRKLAAAQAYIPPEPAHLLAGYSGLH